jgi:hypothetical protein
MKFQAFALSAAASTQADTSIGQPSKLSLPNVDKFVDEARTSPSKPYLARLARVVPQIEAAGLLCTNAVVSRCRRRA